MVSVLGHHMKTLARWFDLTQWDFSLDQHWDVRLTAVKRLPGTTALDHWQGISVCVHGSWWMNVENNNDNNDKIFSSFCVYTGPTHFLGRYLPGGDKSVTALTLKPPWCRRHNFVMPPSIPSWPQGDRNSVFSGRSYSVDGNPLNRSLLAPLSVFREQRHSWKGLCVKYIFVPGWWGDQSHWGRDIEG